MYSNNINPTKVLRYMHTQYKCCVTKPHILAIQQREMVDFHWKKPISFTVPPPKQDTPAHYRKC